MNTIFTNYAEKKAKQILNLLQGYTKGIRITAILILLLMGVSNAWAASTVQGGYIYFDELNSGYTGAGDMQFWVGHGSYSSSYSMSKIDNTKLWYCSAPSWNDATYFAFTSGADWGGGSQKYYDRIGNNTWKSATKESYTLNSGHYYVFKVASTANKAAINFDSPYGHQGSSYTNLNKTITVKAKVSTNGGGSYAEATSPGTLSASSYKFTATSSCASTTSLSSGKITCGYTANTTLTAADANGYTFVGWYNSSGTRQTTDKTLSINPTADATYYAYYTKNTEPSITISTEKTYLRTSYDKLTLNIDYSNIPEGYTYRVHATPEAYFNGNEKGDDVDGVSILGNGNTTFVSHGYLAENQYTVEVILWHNDAATNIKSNSLSITVEPQLSVQTRARFNNQENTTAAEHPQPEWVYPSQHVEETITACEPNPGYTFAGWTANDDNLIKFDNPNSLTTIVTSKVKGNNNAVAYANYAKENCVYFVNTSNWSSVYAYAWNGSGDNVVKNANWPGEKMTKTDETIGGYDVYKYCEPYAKIVFTCGNDGCKTGDLVWEDGKYYSSIGVHGNFSGEWNTECFESFSADGTSASLTLDINQHDGYEFGLKLPDWRSNGGNTTFTRANKSQNVTGTDGNMKFNADVTGEYTFTWTFATNTLTITYPELVKYTVKFDMNGRGDVIPQQEISTGGTVSKPANPTATGYTFGGWYKDANCNTAWNFNTDVVTANTTLYAKWTPTTYTITYKDKGDKEFSGTHKAGHPTQHTYATDTQLKGAGKMGYTFLGWFTNKECTEGPITILGATAYTANITLYAKWDIRNLYIHADFVNNWGEPAPMTQDNNKAVYTYTTTLEPKAGSQTSPYNEGYHFHFVNTVEAPNNNKAYTYRDVQTPTGTNIDGPHLTDPGNPTIQFGLARKSLVTITLTLQSPNDEPKPTVEINALPYSTVTWEVDGEIVRSDELCEGAIITAPEDPSKTGYTFAGWKNKDSQELFSQGKTTMPAQDVTFVAQWTPITYNITYNNGNGIENSTYTIESEEITLPTPTKTGYTFGGWYDNEGCTGEAIATIPQGSTGDKIFYAKWTINSYTITFTTEGGGSVSATVGGNAIASGAPVQYGTSVVLTAFADAGYSFSTWVDGSDNKVTSNPYTVTIDDNITLKAEFIQATTLYLKPNTEWLNNEARFAAYAFDGSDEPVWINMIQKEGECTGIYSCAVPGSYKKVIFCKMNANTASNDWGNKSEQTIDLSIPTDNKNLFTITTKPEGQNWNGEWESEPFNPLAYTITLVGEGGTMEVIHDGESTLGNTTVAPNTVIKIALHPHSGYTLGNNSQIKIGTNDERTLTAEAEYPICGPTTITANWVETKYSVNVKSNNNTYGTVSPTSVNVGQHTPSTKITAAPKPGYRFVNWTATEGVSIATPIWESTTITASQAGTLTANFEKDPVIYLKPSNIWKSDNARFAVYWWADGGKNGWIDMTTVGCNDEYYMAELPAGVTNFQFVRLKPSTEKDYDSSNSGLNFGNKWNQTTDLSLPDNANNLFAMKKLHLNIGNWNEDNKKCYAAHFYNSSNENKTINLIEGDDPMVYYCDIPTDKHYTNVVFYRVDPSNTGNIWQQTNDLSIDGDFYTITSFGGNGNKAEGTWTLQSIGEWLALPLPTITYSQPANGTIIVKTIRGVEIPSGTKVPWDTQVLVSVQPNTGYSVQSANINIGGTVQSVQSGTSYTICGNTTISATMEEHTDYYLVGLDGDWSPKAKNKFVDGKLNINIEGKGTKDFKIIKQQGNTQTWLSTKYTFKPTALKATGITSDNENMKIETMHNGIYQFTWSDGTLTVEYPDVCFLHGDFNDWTDDPSHALYGMDAKVYLEEGVTYEFKVAEKGVYRTQSGNLWQTPITYTEGGKTIIMNDATSYNSEPHHNSKITANMSGVYIFHYNKETKELTVRFPLEPGDYRLAYMEGENTDTFHPERIIKRCISGDQKDIVSFFINHQNNPKIILQKCSTVNANSATWTIENTYVIDNDYSIASTGVFNFVLHQATESDNTTAQLLKKETHPYTGDYYIRTEVAPGKWHSFRRDSHKMTYSSYADDYEPFSHYFCEWVSQTDKGIKNVKFTIANDYGDCISDTLAADPADANPRIVTAESGDLPDSDPNANVRFAWSWRTNKLTRAYLAGANSTTADTYLRIVDAVNLKDENGTNTITEVHFNDLQNWIYQVDVKANNESKIKLTALYAGATQYFKGSAEGGLYGLLSTDAQAEDFKIRLIYDFKTNHLIVAWLPDFDEEHDGGPLGADMMVIRKHNANDVQVTQLTLNNQPLTEVKTVYAVMTFTQDWIKKNSREQSIYWVSFPFDVKLSEAFGFGEYADAWIMQYYDGAERAKKGLYANSGTYWKYIFDKETVLKKGVGYVLVLDLNKVKFNHGVPSVSLYFPSNGEVGTITQIEEPNVTVEVPAHQCNLGVSSTGMDHNITDSHWNLIGVPAFKQIDQFDVTQYHYDQQDASFYYKFITNSSRYDVVSSNSVTFQALYSYMVQFAGTINWTTKKVLEVTPAQLAARRNGESELPEKVVLGLELVQGEEKADQTFVQLQQEGATTNFDMNIDLTKIINNGANIYTLTNDRIQAAGNALPMEESVVPVGVQIAAEGEYTFRMPDGTEGMVVELVDYETNTRTNLLLSDYIITLPKGTSENRFALHIQPEKQVETGVGNIGEGVNNGEAVNKYLIDGKLIIRTAEGVVYDAQGKRM